MARRAASSARRASSAGWRGRRTLTRIRYTSASDAQALENRGLLATASSKRSIARSSVRGIPRLDRPACEILPQQLVALLPCGERLGMHVHWLRLPTSNVDHSRGPRPPRRGDASTEKQRARRRPPVYARSRASAPRDRGLTGVTATSIAAAGSVRSNCGTYVPLGIVMRIRIARALVGIVAMQPSAHPACLDAHRGIGLGIVGGRALVELARNDELLYLAGLAGQRLLDDVVQEARAALG